MELPLILCTATYSLVLCWNDSCNSLQNSNLIQHISLFPGFALEAFISLMNYEIGAENRCKKNWSRNLHPVILNRCDKILRWFQRLLELGRRFDWMVGIVLTPSDIKLTGTECSFQRLGQVLSLLFQQLLLHNRPLALTAMEISCGIFLGSQK